MQIKALFMNRLIYSVILLCSVMTLLSCEPASYSQEGITHRLATVRYTDGKALLSYDPTSTTKSSSASLDNFKTSDDMNRFNLKDGDRGIAQISYRNIPSDNIYSNALEHFDVIKLNELNWNRYEQDTLGTYLHFNVMTLDIYASYKGLWSNGHIASTVITYYPNPDIPSDQNKIDMYLHGFRNDTLSLLVTATVPESDYSHPAQNSLLQYDLSTLRTSDSETADEIIALMDRTLGARDSFYLEITTCDSLEIDNRGHHRVMPGDRMYTKVPFDF